MNGEQSKELTRIDTLVIMEVNKYHCLNSCIYEKYNSNRKKYKGKLSSETMVSVATE